MEQNVIQVNAGIAINVDVSVKNFIYVKKDIINIEKFKQKVIQKYFYWIYHDQRICKHLYCESFVPYFQKRKR